MRESAEALRACIREAAPEGSDPDRRLEGGLAAFLEFVADSSNGWPLLREQLADPKLAARQRMLRGEALGSLVDVLALDPSAAASGAGRARLEQLAEVIAGGAEALAGWGRAHPKAKQSELVTLLMGFVSSGLGATLQPGTPEQRPSG